MATTTPKAKILKLPQIKLNKIQKKAKNVSAQDRSHTERPAAITQLSELMKSREHNILLSYFFTQICRVM